jgi:hypothetical protein
MMPVRRSLSLPLPYVKVYNGENRTIPRRLEE